ncbi:MAG: hypothetical protein AB7K35_08065 [Pseudorhodoplanes sp.]
MNAPATDPDAPAPRPADALMRPERLAALQPCRISASRALLGRAIRERWSITRRHFDIDAQAKGQALYRIAIGSWTFDFPVFSFAFDPKGRTGRIIGRSWDMMGSLTEGPMRPADIATTAEELPKLYSGRATPGTLIWCRSNRSSRGFDHTLERLAAGRQPDLGVVGNVCYLMRNTGLDGNGTFGTRSFRALERDHPLRTSLSAQMLCAYMMRVFAHDLIEHLARCRSPHAVPMAREIARYLGVGNGSALGLVLFVNNRPQLVDRWLGARETALAAAKALPATPGDAALRHLDALLERAIRFRREDRVQYDHRTPSRTIAADLGIVKAELAKLMTGGAPAGRYPLDDLCRSVAQKAGIEAQETLHALMIELVPELADDLSQNLVVSEETVLQPAMTIGELRDLLHAQYRWALDIDLSEPGAGRHIWYKSENAEEPRRGPPDEVENAFNLGLDIPRLAQELDRAIREHDARQSVARLALARPDLRFFIARMQTLRDLHYHSPMMNMMGDKFVPIDIVGMMNVALHGIDKTRDYLNRNLRGVLYHGAPLPDEIAAGTSEEWFWPAEPAA